MAILILLAAATGTGIIASDLGADFYRLLPDSCRRIVVLAPALLWDSLWNGAGAIRATRCRHLILTDLQFTHVRPLFTAFMDLRRMVAGMMNAAMGEEADDIPIHLAVHAPE